MECSFDNSYIAILTSQRFCVDEIVNLDPVMLEDSLEISIERHSGQTDLPILQAEGQE